MPIGTYWLNVNKACQLRCEWCYAQERGYENSNMELQTALAINKIMGDIGANECRILGGEPSLYPHLETLIYNLRDVNVKSAVITNGLAYERKDAAKRLLDTGLYRVSVSLKAGSEESYRRTTGAAAYGKALKAIENFASLGARMTVSITMSQSNQHEVPMMVRDIATAGAQGVHLAFCTPIQGEETSSLYDLWPQDYQPALEAAVETLEAWNVPYGVELMIPFCWLDPDFTASLFERGRVGTACASWSKGGIAFGIRGEAAFCNSILQYPFGIYGRTFRTADDLQETYLAQTAYFDMMKRVPSDHCVSCPVWKWCGGGCPLRWTAIPSNTITGGEKYRDYLERMNRCVVEKERV